MSSLTFGYGIYFCMCILILGLNDDGFAHNYGIVIYWWIFIYFQIFKNLQEFFLGREFML
jgi:hypothetical protein